MLILDKEGNNFLSYKQIYKNMKYVTILLLQFSNKLLIDFLKVNNNDLENKMEEEIITLEKRKFVTLKNSFIK